MQTKKAADWTVGRPFVWWVFAHYIFALYPAADGDELVEVLVLT